MSNSKNRDVFSDKLREATGVVFTKDDTGFILLRLAKKQWGLPYAIKNRKITLAKQMKIKESTWYFVRLSRTTASMTEKTVQETETEKEKTTQASKSESRNDDQAKGNETKKDKHGKVVIKEKIDSETRENKMVENESKDDSDQNPNAKNTKNIKDTKDIQDIQKMKYINDIKNIKNMKGDAEQDVAVETSFEPVEDAKPSVLDGLQANSKINQKCYKNITMSTILRTNAQSVEVTEVAKPNYYEGGKVSLNAVMITLCQMLNDLEN